MSSRSFLVAGCILATRCIPYTPPTRALPLETAAPVGDGRTGVQVEGAGFASGNSELASAALRARRGVGRDTDVSVESTVMRAGYATSDRFDTWAQRLGAKRRIACGFALEGGLGGGAFSGGGFGAPDVGAIASWGNGIFEPFAAARGSLSIPLVPRDIGVGDAARPPRVTWFGALTIGARVPIGPRARRCAARAGDDVRGALLFGGGWTWFGDFFGNSGRIDALAAAGEITF
jgi:hypothetical protein